MAKSRKKAYFYLIIIVLIWSAAASVVKLTLRGFDPFVFLAYRFLISAAIAVPILVLTKIQWSRVRKYLPAIILYSLLATTFSLGALFIGLDRSTVLDLNLLATLGPLLIAFGGAKLFHDKITHREKVGISIAVCGTLFALFVPLLISQASFRLTGNIFLVIHLITDVSAILLVKRLVRKNLSAISISSIAFIVGALTTGAITFYVYGWDFVINQIITAAPRYHAGVFYMALLSGTVAYYLLIQAEKSLEVSEAGLFGYLNPVFATIIAVTWLGESITLPFIIGAVIIGFGVFHAEYKHPRNRHLKKLH